jgi:hypothetical protein
MLLLSILTFLAFLEPACGFFSSGCREQAVMLAVGGAWLTAWVQETAER